MKRFVATVLTAAALLMSMLASPALADPNPPTNGGSANGNGASGQCTGSNAERPPSCHNSTGGDGN